jgi:hypothetical protein
MAARWLALHLVGRRGTTTTHCLGGELLTWALGVREKKRVSGAECAAVRFVRRLISLENGIAFQKHVVTKNLFEPIVDIFLANGDKYNLLNSAIIELMDYIYTTRIKILTKYVVEKFYDKVKDVTYVPTFKNLKILYDENEYNPPTVTPPLDMPYTDNTRENDKRKYLEEQNEEAWFSSDESGLSSTFDVENEGIRNYGSRPKREYDVADSSAPPSKRAKLNTGEP